MNQSTIIMPCNYTGATNPLSTKGWAVLDFDWSNWKGHGDADGWSKHKPMDCEELLVKQVHLTRSISPGTTVWVYRNSIKALPWYSSVREKLEDPAYGSWFLNFSGQGSYHVPVCDENYNPPLCSNMYHDQDQTPGFPHGDGDCAAPACDTGSVPTGEYVFNPLAVNISVRNQTFLQWFIDDYLFGPNGGGLPEISGFFFDDMFNPDGPTEYEGHAVADMGLSKDTLQQMSDAYWAYMAQVYDAVLARGKFSWQQLWTGQDTGICTTCPEPLVKKETCATDLRTLCRADSPAQTRAMMYAFAPGGCVGDPKNLTTPTEDLANFLLVRGKYAWLGHGWLGCSLEYEFPPLLNADFGEPTGLCQETKPNSNIFVREWTRASIQMDCNTYTPIIKFK
jgi:hypothetical protein